jgi:hypothetical protein
MPQCTLTQQNNKKGNYNVIFKCAWPKQAKIISNEMIKAKLKTKIKQNK